MINRKILLGTVLAAAVCLSACAEDGEEVPSANENTVSVTETETAVTPGGSGGEEELSPPLTADPVSAVKAYLQKLSESGDVTSVRLLDTKIWERYSLADKYYESPLAERFGIAEDTLLVPVLADYRIEYAENSGLEGGKKSEYFIVKCGENGFDVTDVFAYDPRKYYGEVKELLTDGDGNADFCTVELDGGLGTVKCSYAVRYPDTRKIEIGERIHIYANGDIYGDPPRIDAEFIASESEAEDLENAE